MIFRRFYPPLDLRHQLTRPQPQRRCETPKRLEIGLLASVLDHRQVGACDTSQPTQHVLR